MTVNVAIAQINSTLGDFEGNRAKIADFARRAAGQGADIVLTPELSLVGYPPEDLLLRQSFYTRTEQALKALAADLAGLKDLHVVVGHPLQRDGVCFNAASVLLNGELFGTYCKYDLPNSTVFDEKRYFASADLPLVFAVKGVRFGINICEDTWSGHAPARAKEAGAQVLLVPNGSPYHMNKQHLRQEVMRTNVTSQGMSLVYANLVGGQDELIFDGNSFVLDQSGKLAAQLRHFEEEIGRAHV